MYQFLIIAYLFYFALPKLIYARSSLQYPPKEIIKEIEKNNVCFHLGRKTRKDKKGNINSGLRKGRFKMIDLEMFIMSLKISWLKRISISENNRTINYIYLEKLKHVGGKLFFEYNFSPDDVSSIVQKNTFRNEILTTWCKCNIKKSILSYRNEIMCNNYDIKAGGKTIFYANGIKMELTSLKTFTMIQANIFIHFHD